jgi:hypothetical protein
MQDATSIQTKAKEKRGSYKQKTQGQDADASAKNHSTQGTQATIRPTNNEAG